ncbi:hypothetical protein U8V72_15315 [Priestia filamentosa]|uniref:hypothetical protein n=1 Tax=Priestia filamentosa TaxID=1402861 RepID=UPI0005891884
MTTEVRKEVENEKELFIKFYPVAGDGSYLYLSGPLFEEIRETKMKYISFGTIPKLTNAFFMKINNRKEGLCLLDRSKRYRYTSIGSTRLFNSLKVNIPNISKNENYKVILLAENIYFISLTNTEQLEESLSTATNLHSIKWLENSAVKQRVAFSIKFYTSSSPSLYLSHKLRNAARKSGKNHMLFGVNQERDTLILKFTDDQEKMGLIKNDGYANLIGATNLYRKAAKLIGNVENGKTYVGKDIDDLTYAFNMRNHSKEMPSLNSIDFSSVTWLDLDK